MICGRDSHVCLIDEERIVAYAGWLPVTESDGEKWMKGHGELRPVASASTNAAALTMVSVTRRSLIPPLIRACRTLAPQRIIYFKRDYGSREAKKSKVVNTAAKNT